MYNKLKFQCFVLWLGSGNFREEIGVFPSTANCYGQLPYGSIFAPRTCAVPPAEGGTPRKEFHMILQKERWFSKLLNWRDKTVCLSYLNKRTQTYYDSVVNEKLYKRSFNSVVLNRREFCVFLESLFVTPRGHYYKLYANRYFSMQILPALRSG